MLDDIYYYAVEYSPVVLTITATIICTIVAGNIFWGAILGLLLTASVALMMQKASDNTLRQVKTVLKRRRNG
jgi:hypothetical protein